MQNVYEVLSIFSGGGLLDLGFIIEGFEIAEAVEINDNFIQAYNFGISSFLKSSRHINSNFKSIKHNQIKSSNDLSDKNTQKFFKSNFYNISGVIGGPPCQDYSVGGKNKGIEGERGKLINSYLNLINKVRPKFLLFENVEGLYKTKKHRSSFNHLIRELKRLNYTIWFDVINPLHYGFPQDRPRVIIVGFSNRIISGLKQAGLLIERRNSILKTTSLDIYAFKWPKIINEDPKSLPWPSTNKFGTEPPINPDMMKKYKSMMVTHAFKNIDSLPNQDEYFNPKSEKFIKIDEGDTKRKSFKRLHRYRFSPTVAYGNNEVHLHPFEPRRISVREALRLQTVPDEYVLPKELSLTSKFKLIGNGVPTAQASLIAKEIRRTLELYDSIYS